VRIAVADVHVPFVEETREAETLRDALRKRGHLADVVRVPFRPPPGGPLLDQMLAVRLLRVPQADRVVTLRFPATLLPCDSVVAWLLEEPGTEPGAVALRAEGAALRSAERVLACSPEIAAQVRERHGIEAELLERPGPGETSAWDLVAAAVTS
jgi:hypothetical protein